MLWTSMSYIGKSKSRSMTFKSFKFWSLLGTSTYGHSPMGTQHTCQSLEKPGFPPSTPPPLPHIICMCCSLCLQYLSHPSWDSIIHHHEWMPSIIPQTLTQDKQRTPWGGLSHHLLSGKSLQWHLYPHLPDPCHRQGPRETLTLTPPDPLWDPALLLASAAVWSITGGVDLEPGTERWHWIGPLVQQGCPEIPKGQPTSVPFSGPDKNVPNGFHLPDSSHWEEQILENHKS